MIGWLALSGGLILLDQLSKSYIQSVLRFGERINVLTIFDLTLLYNEGAAWSFLADSGGWQKWLFISIGILAAVVIIWLMKRHGHQKRFMLSLALILAGAVGNVIDRILHGHVIDFLLFYCRDWYYPAFNVADIAISCGAILLVLDEILRGFYAKSAK